MKRWFLALMLTVVSSQHIAIITLSAYQTQPDYLAKSIVNKALYAEKHNYTLLVYPNLDVSRPPAWSKIKAIQSAMYSRSYDWVFWIDGDTVITNMSVRLQDFIPHDNATNIVISRDCQSLNTGITLWKASPISYHLLELIYRGRHVTHEVVNHFWWEQKSFVDLYNSNEMLRNVTRIIPQSQWNSYHYESKCGLREKDGVWSPGDFMIHFSGIHSDKRGELFRKYVSQVV